MPHTLLALLGLLVPVGAPAASPALPAAPPAADWYVDAAASCAAGTGTPSAPFCTISEALAVAAGGDAVFIAPGTYLENLTVDVDLRVVGTRGREVTLIDGGGAGSVFQISSGARVTLEGLTIRGGVAPWGGGISTVGTLTLRDSTVSGNRAVGAVLCPPVVPSCTTVEGAGGGIFVAYGAGQTELVNCTVANNVGFAPHPQGVGGGLYASNAGRVLISGCTFDGNVEGALRIIETPLLLVGSTISGNDASRDAAVFVSGLQPVELRSSTICDNLGGGLTTTSFVPGPLALVENVTITGNGPGRGWEQSALTAPEVRGSLLAGNGAGPGALDVTGYFSSLGHNLVGAADPFAGFGAPGDQVGTAAAPLDARLAPLAASGGPTRTRAPLAGSPAVDAGPTVNFYPTDQRGFARVGVPDIGAHEFGSSGGAPVGGCASVPNSTGAVGVIGAAGSFSVSDDALTLAASSLPGNALAIFLTSLAPGFTAQPGGSAGNLCLGGAPGRFVGPGQIRNTGAAGAITLALDLDRHPTPGALVAVGVGDTWYFQAWHRDAGATGATSNFTAATRVTFTQ